MAVTILIYDLLKRTNGCIINIVTNEIVTREVEEYEK